jgi:type III secretion system low calcium response chaperone LcrH/SycD
MEGEEKKMQPEITKELLEQFNAEMSSEGPSKAATKMVIANNLAAGSAAATLKGILSQAINSGIMPRQALKLSDDTMEAIYGQGYNLYNQGKYKEASYVFRLLMLLDYLTSKYMMGLAACLHRLHDYKQAANTYLLCGTLDPKNPLPHYHAADCYLQLQVPMLAILSLGLAVAAAGDQPQYAIIKERASLMRETLTQQLNLNETKPAEAKQDKK